MKYKLYIYKRYILPESKIESLSFAVDLPGSTGINYVIGSLDEKYLSYYVKGVERVISGELEYMYIDGSEELEDWESLEVRRDKVRSQMLGEREQEIGTEDFLEILKIMKREYGVGDEVVVDPRSENFFSIRELNKRGLHSFSAAVKAYGAENVRKLNVRNMTSWGAYECDLEVYINNVWTKVSGSVKTMWPDSWSEVMIKQAIEEAWSNATYFEGQNTWKGVTKDGKEVLFYNSTPKGVDPTQIKGKINNSFPKVK